MEQEPSTPEAPNYSLLAKDVFGGKFKGEVREATPPVEAQAEPQEQQGEELETQEAPDTKEAPETTEQPETLEDNSDDGETISSLTDLLEAEGYDQETFMNLEVEQKVNGETRRVKLSDLVATDQTLEAAEQRLKEAKEKATTQNQALAEKTEKLESSLAAAAKLLENVESTLKRDIEAVDPDLRRTDPAEWAARQREFELRQKEIDALKSEAYSTYQSAAQPNQEEALKEAQALLEQERTMLLEKLPEWADSEVAAAEQKAIGSYLMNQGFTQQDVANAYDHRLIVMANKARLYDESKGKAEPAKKKLKALPKTLKSGPKKSDAQINQIELEKSRSRLRSTNKLDDAVALLRSRRGKN